MDHQEALIKNLRLASNLNDTETVVKILSDDCQLINLPHVVGNTLNFLFHNAMCNVNEELIEFLVKFVESLNLGAYIHDPEEILKWALDLSEVKVVQLMLQNGAKLVGEKYAKGSPAIHVFKCCKNINTRKEILLLLIQHGLNIGYKNNKSGCNLLHESIHSTLYKSDEVEISEILINYGVPVDELNTDGFSPLHCAIFKQNYELISFLIKSGADVNKRTFLLESPLCLAVKYGDRLDIIDLLLSSGAEINTKNKFESTALHSACYYSKNKMISSLVQKGADLSAVDRRGMIPIDYTLNYSHVYPYRRLGAIVKEIARLKFENLMVPDNNMHKIQGILRFKQHFEKCLAELDLMANSKFYGPYTYYSVLKIFLSTEKLACLLKNEKIVQQFRKNLNTFSHYRSDLKTIFKKAIRFRDMSNIVNDRLYAIFEKILPDIVIRKVAKNLTVEDLPVDQ